MADVHPGYLSHDLYLPRDFDDEFSDLLVSRERGSDKPFPRKVDLWWATICIGASLGEHYPVAKDRSKFNTGQVFAQEQWRISHMELLALARDGDSAISEPGRVIEIAEEYGMAGIGWITDHLRGSSRPILKLLMELEAVEGTGVAV